MPELLLLRGAMGAGKTSTAAKLLHRVPDTAIVEIDDIKVQKHGTALTCNPAIDFKEAGAQAKLALDEGKNVIVIEPLCDREHVCFVLDGAGLSEESPCVSSFWLHCSLDTALRRKGHLCHSDIIRSQFRRYAARFKLKGEIIIHTDTTSVDEVATQVLQSLGQRFRDPK